MKCVIPRLIQLDGEWAADPDRNWPQITMSDFPKLEVQGRPSKGDQG
jgi:hypothetical protein